MNIRIDEHYTRIRLSPDSYSQLKNQGLIVREFTLFSTLTLSFKLQFDPSFQKSELSLLGNKIQIKLCNQDLESLGAAEFRKEGIFLDRINLQVDLIKNRS